MAKLKLPFELEKPSANEWVTKADQIGYGEGSVSEVLDDFKKVSADSAHEFALGDGSGKNIATFDSGHIRTKNFNSQDATNHIASRNNPHNVSKEQVGLGNVDNTSDQDKPISNAVAQELAQMPSNSNSTHEFAIGDDNGHNIFTIDNGHVKTKKFDSEDIEERVEELESHGNSDIEAKDSRHEFAIGDEDGHNVMTFDDGYFRTKNFDAREVKQKIDSYVDTSISNAVEVVTTWNVGYYLKTDGTIATTTAIPQNQVSDYIEYTPYMRVQGGFVRGGQGYILAIVYNDSYQKVGYVTALRRQDFYARYGDTNTANVEYWDELFESHITFDTGYGIDDVSYVKVQGHTEYHTRIYKAVNFDYIANPFRSYSGFGKSFAFFGGSFSVFRQYLYNYMRYCLQSQVFPFGMGGAGFGWDSCHYEGYSGDPVMIDNKVQFLDSIPKQVERAINYCQTNGLTDGFDNWVLWASTNDFNTHIKDKGSVDYTIADLQSEAQYGNRDTQDGGIIWCIYRIKTLYPKAKIFFFGSLPFFSDRYGYDLTDTTKPTKTCMQEDGTRGSRTQTNTFAEFIADQEAICNKYHIPYFNQMEAAQMNEWNYQSFYNPSDNYLHPLEPAYILWSNQQISFLINH